MSTRPDWSWIDSQRQIDRPGWRLLLARCSPDCACWQRGDAMIYQRRGEVGRAFSVAVGGCWLTGLFDSFEEAAAYVG